MAAPQTLGGCPWFLLLIPQTQTWKFWLFLCSVSDTWGFTVPWKKYLEILFFNKCLIWRKKIYPASSPISSCAMLIKTLTAQNHFIQQLWKKSDVNFAFRFVTLPKQSSFLKFLFQINVKSMMTILTNCFSTIWSVLQKPLVSKFKR